MKVACWEDDRYGPAFVGMTQFAVPPPDTASIPDCPPGPKRRWAAKGTDVRWPQWAEHLAESLPIGGRWTLQDVPDGLSARQALAHLREAAQEQGLT